MIQGTPPLPPDIPGPPFDPNLLLMTDWGPPVLVMIVALGLLAGTLVLLPIMRALGRRLEGKGAPDPALRAEIEHLQQRLGDMDQLQQRVAELEDRLDFTERIVAQGREPDRLQR